MVIKQNCRPYKTDKTFEKGKLGSYIIPWNSIKKQQPKIAILGISKIDASTIELQNIRKELYNLNTENLSNKITDLGDLISYNITDISIIVKEIQTYLSSKNIVLIIMSADYEFIKELNFEEKNNNIKDTVYISHSTTEVISNLISKKNKSKTKRVIGTQIYFNSKVTPPEYNLINYRISEIRNKLQEVEPEFRNSSLCHIDMRSIRHSDFPCNETPMPNGFYGEETCRLAWFAGNSNSISTYIQTGYNQQFDQNRVGAMLYAQIIWHFISGVVSRVNEDPYLNIGEFKEYYVNSSLFGQYIIFYKSRKTEKYWLKVPGNKLYLPCSENDMKTFVNNKIPDRLIENIKIKSK